jgi:hypothetical protein
MSGLRTVYRMLGAWRSGERSGRKLLIIAALATLPCVVGVPSALAAGLSATPVFPSSEYYYQSKVPGSIQITNNSGLEIAVTSISLTPACAYETGFGTCSKTSPNDHSEPGIFSIDSPAKGSGQGCNNYNEPVSIEDGATGEVGFYGSNFALFPGQTCTINFTFMVTGEPGKPPQIAGDPTGTTYPQLYVTAQDTDNNFLSAGTATKTLVKDSTPQDPPTGVSATGGVQQATVSFTPPSNLGTPPVTGYTVKATDVTTSANGGQTASGTASPITITGLTAGDTYTFTVSSEDGVYSEPSSASNQVTPTGPPGAPSIGTATPGPGEANVSLSKPGSTGGSAITGYTVTAIDNTTPANGGQTAVWNYNDCPVSCAVKVTGLTNGDSYTFTATASAANGTTGPASAASNAVVPASLMIDEVRYAGPGGGGDSYLDVFNPNSYAVSLNGWRAEDYFSNWNFGATPTLPAHAHYLIAFTDYSLSSFTSANLTARYTGSMDGFNLLAPDLSVSDAVGYTTGQPAFREGTGLTVPTTDSGGATAGQGMFVRKFSAGAAVDTGNNANDFTYVATDITAGDTTSSPDGISGATFGSPAPADLASPVQANASLPSALYSTAVSASQSPNRIYDPVAGTLTVHRKITNNTGAPISQLDLQLTSLTTYGDAGAGQAELVAVNSSGDGISQGTTLITPTNSQTQGGLDSIWSVNLPGGTLAAGASVDVEMVFHVVRGGSFSFGYNALAPSS